MNPQDKIVKDVYGSVKILDKDIPMGISVFGIGHVNVRKLYRGIEITDLQTDVDISLSNVDDVMLLTNQLGEDMAKAIINALDENSTQAVNIIVSLERVNKSYIGSERDLKTTVTSIQRKSEEYMADVEQQGNNALPKQKRKFVIDKEDEDPRAKNAINTDESPEYKEPDDVFDGDQGLAGNEIEVINADDDDEIKGGKAKIEKKNNQTQHKNTVK